MKDYIHKTFFLFLFFSTFLAGDVFSQEDSLSIDEDMALILHDSVEFEGIFSAEGLQAVKIKGKWGYRDRNYKAVIPYIYENAGDFEGGLAEVRKDSKWGFIDPEGKVIIPFLYEDAQRFSDGLAAVKYERKWGFINPKGEWIIANLYEDAYCFKDERAVVMLKEKWGHIDTKGNVIIPLAYDFADDFNLGVAIVEKSGLMGGVNQNGQLIIPTQFTKIRPIDSTVILVQKNRKWGVINQNGQELAPCIYDNIDPVMDGYSEMSYLDEMSESQESYGACKYLIITLNEQMGVLSKNGSILIPPQYSYVSRFNDLWELVQDELIGYADSTGKILIKPKYTQTNISSNEMSPVAVNGAWGVLSKDGTEIIPPRYEEIGNYSEGLFAVKSGDSWGFIDKDENIIIPFLFDYANDFKYGSASVKKGSRWGLIDLKGKLALYPEYEEVTQLPDKQHAIGVKNSKYYLINLKNQKPTKKAYDAISFNDTENHLIVNLGANQGCTDFSGNVIIPVKYEDVRPSGILNHYWVAQNGLFGLMNSKKSWVIKPQYQMVEYFYEGVSWVMKNDEYLYITPKGEVVEPSYNSNFGSDRL